MNEYVIYCDSACDIVPEVLGEWGVKVACLSYHFSSESRNYLDNEIPAKDFYDKMRAGGVAKTAAVNAETFRRAFEEDLKQGSVRLKSRKADSCFRFVFFVDSYIFSDASRNTNCFNVHF